MNRRGFIKRFIGAAMAPMAARVIPAAMIAEVAPPKTIFFSENFLANLKANTVMPKMHTSYNVKFSSGLIPDKTFQVRYRVQESE